MTYTENPTSFAFAYNARLAAALVDYRRGNHDPYRFGPLPDAGLVAGAKEFIRTMFARSGLVPASTVQSGLKVAATVVEPHLAKLEWLYGELEDHESRQVLVDVVAYRALGRHHIVMPLNTPEYWKAMQRIEASGSGETWPVNGFESKNLLRRPTSANGQNVTLLCTPGSIMMQYELEQYRCRTAPHDIAVEPGDVALDCGGCWADTALYLAAHAGAGGKVHCFEFIPGNIEVAENNLALNPELAASVRLHEYAVWDQSGQTFFYSDRGPASRVHPEDFEGSDGRATSISIDDFVAREDLGSVDFIKMDIEGAEMAAIEGARKTIRTLVPKLAISVYHRFSDLVEVPWRIRELNPNYRLYLRHFTTHMEETVLFARSDHSTL